MKWLEWLTGLGEIFYLPLEYKRIEFVNSQMEEGHRAGYGERVWSPHVL